MTNYLFLILLSLPVLSSDYTLDGESPNILIHGDLSTSLIELDQIKSGETQFQPWSGDYFALDRGGISFRFGDPEVRSLWKKTRSSQINETWKVLNDQFKNNSPESYIEKGFINQLSPAEKYDLLIGDANFTLTKRMWEYGKGNYHFYKNKRSQWSWMGFCDGWAYSSIYFQRPAKSVSVLAKNGIDEITFYPSDIKALLSLLYAHGSTGVSMTRVGRSCELPKGKIPKKTIQNAKNPKYKNCFDVNPASFHLALINQIGRYKKSFVMDITPSKDVWNHPIKSFKYNYKKVKKQRKITDKNTNKFSQALQHISFSDEKLRALRSPKAQWILRVEMLVEYATERHASSQLVNNRKHDLFRKKKYVYDLEIDNQLQIVGGEWLSHDHPDYLGGTYKKLPTLTSPYQDFLKGHHWDGESLVPDIFSEMANTFERDGVRYRGVSHKIIPQSAIVLKLLEMSQITQ